MRSAWFVSVFLSASFLGLGPSAWAAPAVTTRYDYYDIQGGTKDELRQAMQRHPSSHVGGEHDASTEWNIRWSYQSGPAAGGGCGITSYDLSMDVVFHMPRWSNASILQSVLKLQWDGFARALQNHEDGHARIAKDCFREVEQAIQKTGSYRDCNQVGGRVSNAVNMTIAKYKQKERDYDMQTDHGVKQGAVW